MSYIQVDHSKFEKAAKELESYVAAHRRDMTAIDQQVNNLKSSWKGQDYQQLKIEWQQMNAADSTSGKMLKAVEDYAGFLRAASNTYKNAQINAVNKANGLSTW